MITLFFLLSTQAVLVVGASFVIGYLFSRNDSPMWQHYNKNVIIFTGEE